MSSKEETKVLRAGASVVALAACSDAGFVLTARTLAVARLVDGSIVQVHTLGIRRIASDGARDAWVPSGHRTIARAACNSAQVAVALVDGYVALFGLNDAVRCLPCSSSRVPHSPICPHGFLACCSCVG
jgi:hypothetical protein